MYDAVIHAGENRPLIRCYLSRTVTCWFLGTSSLFDIMGDHFCLVWPGALKTTWLNIVSRRDSWGVGIELIWRVLVFPGSHTVPCLDALMNWIDEFHLDDLWVGINNCFLLIYIVEKNKVFCFSNVTNYWICCYLWLVVKGYFNNWSSFAM